MGEKTITEIISEFTEESKQVSAKSREIKDTAESLRLSIGAVSKSLTEESKGRTEREKQTEKLFEEQFQKRKEFFETQFKELQKTQIEADLTPDNKNSIITLQKNLKWFNRSLYGVLGVGLLSLLMLFGSIYFATRFYGESVKTKSEIRAEILAEMEQQGKGIYNKKEVAELETDITIVKEWMKKNPKSAQGLMQYRDGKLSK